MIAEMESYIHCTHLLIQAFCIDKSIICIFRFRTTDQSVAECAKKGQLLWRLMERSEIVRQAAVGVASV